MAKLTDELKEYIVNLWRAGDSQNSISKRFPNKQYPVSISVTTVNKLCKGVPQDNVALVEAQVYVNQALSQKVDKEVNTINQLVEEKTRHLKFFTDSALRNQQLANRKLEEKGADPEDGLTFMDLNAHSQITLRNKEAVIGKSPDTAIQINNNVSVADLIDELG